MALPRLSRSLAALLACALAATLATCTYGHQDSQTAVYRPLVFPGEARLGATAFMVLDSNYFQTDDALERYDLWKDRVEIRLDDDSAGNVPLTLRGVFAVQSGRATTDAELRPNAWVVVALFDLTRDDAGSPVPIDFAGPYPQHLPLQVWVDGALVPELAGEIWIVGTGGAPTALGLPSPLPALEDALAPHTMVRLRARNGGSDGFDPSWQIGSITAEVVYDPACLSNARIHTGSDAVRGGAFLGQPFSVSASQEAVRLFLTQPKGLELAEASTSDTTRLGEGPILDVVFDRAPGCATPLEQAVSIHGLRVTDLNGQKTSLDRPDLGQPGSLSSSFFDISYVDPELAP